MSRPEWYRRRGMPALVIGGGEGGAHLSVPVLYVLPTIVFLLVP